MTGSMVSPSHISSSLSLSWSTIIATTRCQNTILFSTLVSFTPSVEQRCVLSLFMFAGQILLVCEVVSEQVNEQHNLQMPFRQDFMYLFVALWPC